MIHIFCGTKAQIIKMAPIMVELKARSIPYNFIHSGQHHETIQEILDNFNLREPDYYVSDKRDVAKKSHVLAWLYKCEKATRPSSVAWRGKLTRSDIILVHGDTLSTIVGALAAKRNKVACAHIESGLRSRNFFNPFPEEAIRVLTFKICDILFCPDEEACENVSTCNAKIVNTAGNTLIDSTFFAVNKEYSSIFESDHVNYAIASIHRYENIFSRSQLTTIIESIEYAARDRKVFFIVHPPTKIQLKRMNLWERLSQNRNITLSPRLDHTTFVKLLAKSEFIISDGGSNQEESSYLGIPCLLMRKASERHEGLNENVVLSHLSNARIKAFIDAPSQYKRSAVSKSHSPSALIVDNLRDYY